MIESGDAGPSFAYAAAKPKENMRIFAAIVMRRAILSA